MDKEQIIIDGVDVKNCKGIDLGLSPLAKCKFLKFRTSDGGIAGIWCSDHTNCYYKQLVRKTQERDFWKYQAELGSETTDRLAKQLEEREQECEELKSESFTREELISLQEKDIDRYRKALEEIEEATKEISNYLNIGCDMDKCEDCNHFKPFCTNQCVCFLIGQGDLILDIINKAKGGGDKQQ